MPAESGMIRRLRAWSEAESEKQRELNYWRTLNAQASRNDPGSYQRAVMQSNAAAFNSRPSSTNDFRPCSELELLKLGALGSRTERKPSPLDALGSLLG
jgi:hypothetical protein